MFLCLKNPAFVVSYQGRNGILKLFAFNRPWMAAGGSQVPDSQKEKGLAGLVKFSTDSLEMEFSTDKIAMTSVTLVAQHIKWRCTQFACALF